MQNEKPRAWSRFSVRSLLLITTLLTVTFGAAALYLAPYRQQARSLAVVNRLHGEVELVPTIGSSWKRWLVTAMLGQDAYVEAVHLDLSDKQVDDSTLDSLTGLVSLRTLILDKTQITDAGTQALKSFPRLHTLSLRFTNLSDASAENLGALPNLKQLYLTRTKISDSSLGHLSKLKQLKELYVRWTKITDAGAERLQQALPACSVFNYQAGS